MIDLSGRTALVTGASMGIGRTIALGLAEAGCSRIGLFARSEDKLKEVAAAINERGAEGIVLTGSVTNSEDVKAAVDRLLENDGKIDILINNAGITRDGLIMRMKDEDWDAVLDVNLKGAFIAARAVSRTMSKNRSGVIINISSVIGLMGNPGQTNYASSKAGLIGFAKSLAKELAGRGVRVNVICPGYIETEMTKELGDEAREYIVGNIPLGRVGQPEDIAHLVSFLVSPLANYITGAVIPVDGGMVM